MQAKFIFADLNFTKQKDSITQKKNELFL